MSLSLRPLLAVFALAAVAACAQEATPPPARVPVTVGLAARRAVPYELLATGTVEPIQTVAVQAQVSGPIVRIAFREGQDVKKGQVLFELDPRPFQAALEQAQALLSRDRATARNAEQDVKRYGVLAEKEYVTAQQNDAVRTTAAAASATVASSQAAVDQARLNLQYATIRAPIAGRTGSLRVREGNLVRSTDAPPLVTINQIQPILAAVRGAGEQPAGDPEVPGPEDRGVRATRSAAAPRARAPWPSSTTRSTPRPAPSCSRPASRIPMARSGRARS